MKAKPVLSGVRPSALLARGVCATVVCLVSAASARSRQDGRDHALAQAGVRELRAEAVGLRSRPRMTAGNLVRVLHRASTQQEYAFDRHLAELEYSRHLTELEKNLENVLDEKLKQLVVEHKCCARTLKTANRCLQVAAGVFTMTTGVAIWVAFSQVRGTSIIPLMHPTIRFTLSAILTFNMVLLSFLGTAVMVKWLWIRLIT